MSEEKEKPNNTVRIYTIFRRIVQLISFLLINYVILEAVFNTELDVIGEIFQATPFIHNASNAWAAGAGYLEFSLYAISRGTIPYLFIAMIGVFGLLTGRFACGWICPTGFMQDIFAGLSTRNKRVSVEADRQYKKLKSFLLVVAIVIIAPMGYYAVNSIAQYAEYSDAIGVLADDPAGPFSLNEFLFTILPEFITSIVEDMDFTYLFSKENAWRAVLFFLYLIVISLSISYPRWYCRYMCIYGAAAKIFSEYSIVKLQRLPTRCVGRKACGACERACPMAIRILDEDFDGFTGEGECILCLKCMEACKEEEYDAIKFKLGL